LGARCFGIWSIKRKALKEAVKKKQDREGKGRMKIENSRGEKVFIKCR
jgi:hypothetical protein